MIGNLVKYSNFYSDNILVNPIELILDIPKNELIATIVSVNSKLKPVNSNHFDDSRDTQIECLKAIFLDNKNNNPATYNCLPIINRFTTLPAHYSLFNRVTCLYALQEIICRDDFSVEDQEWNFDNRERIFKFLLIVNDFVLSGDKNYKEEGYNQLGSDFFEFFMFRELHHNQYNECSNTVNIFHKTSYLLEVIENSENFGNYFKYYFTWKYNVSSISEALKFILWSYIKSNDEELKLRYLNIPNDNIDAVKILNVLSEVIEYEIPNDNLSKFDFLPLKKSPLYKSKMKKDEHITTYLILDDIFFLDKFYSLFINDFWFDFLEPNNICERKDWGNYIGSTFFENFIEDILVQSFSTNLNYVLSASKQLTFNYEGSSIEYADFYIRDNQNIALFEAKSGFIPLINGYKTVKNIEDYRNLDLEKFYKDYGLTQLAEKTIKKFHQYKYHIEDTNFNKERKVQIYPLIVVNDPILSSSIFSFVFKRKFNELLKKEGINKKQKLHNIKELTVLNVYHLQDMEQSLINKENDFFQLLDYYHIITDVKNVVNRRNDNYLRTFDHVLDKKVKTNLISDRIKDLNWLKI